MSTDLPVVRRSRPRRRSALVWLGAIGVALGAGAVVAAVVLQADAPEPDDTNGAAAVATPLLSARRVPAWTTAPLAGRNLTAALLPVVAQAPPGTCVRVGEGEKVWFDHNGSVPLTPASNMKVLTAAAALDILGPDTTLSTSFRSLAPPAAGVVEGNLYMVGGGDPLLTTEGRQGARQPRAPETDLEGAADALVAAGVRQVNGSVVGDASRYDAQLAVPTWPARFQTGGTVGPLSALLVNDGWQIDPTTGEGPGGPTPDPAGQAAAVMTQLLIERGVVVTGFPSAGVAPAEATSLLEVPSLPVSALVQQVLAYSDNTSADLLVKEIGKVRSGTGSTAAGTAAILEWARTEGLPVDGVVMLDGSGLSYENRLTCDLLGAVWAREDPAGTLAAGLAVPGQPGTLSDRFGTAEWAERLRAKTGTLNTVAALTGFLQSRPGTPFDFEIIVNTTDRRAGNSDLALQERILTALLDQPLAPPVAEAGPLPASS